MDSRATGALTARRGIVREDIDASQENRLQALTDELGRLARRVERLEQGIGSDATPRPSPGRLPPAPAEGSAGESRSAGPPRVETPRPAPGKARKASWDRPALDLEDLLGGRVLAWIGGSAIVLGVVLFLVMAVSRGWIDEPTRVVLAFLGSSALLLVGLYLYERQGKTQAALAAVASAIAALYASVTAATQLYDLISPALGLGVAALVGAAATAIAVRWSSPLVAALGILGALLAPILVEAPTSGVTLAFMAIALASATGVLLWQRWDWLASGAFLISSPQLFKWVDENYRDQLGLALTVLVLFWGLWVVAAIGYELRVPIAALRLSSGLLLFANAVLVTGLGYWILDEQGHETGATTWVLLLALGHVALGVSGFHGRMSNEIGALLIAVGTALSAIGLALALSGPALVVGWAVEAALLSWIAHRSGDRRGHVGAAAFLALSAVHILLFEAQITSALREGVPELGEAAVALFVFALATFFAARFSERQPTEWRFVLEGAAAGALVYLASIAIVDALAADADAVPGQTPQVALSAFWSITGLVALVYGLARDDRRFRLGGLGLLGITIMKVFVYDLAELDSIYRVLSFIALGLLLLAGAFAYQRLRLSAGGEEAP